MRRTRKFQAGAEDRGVEIDDRTKLDLDAELHHRWRERLAIKDPAAAISKRGSEGREEAVAFFVAEALDIERLHG